MKCGNAAFFDEGKVVQTMGEHVEQGLEVIDLYIARNYHLKIARILDLSDTICKAALYASYAFHDVGKCAEVYQKNRSSFKGHEYISAKTIAESTIPPLDAARASLLRDSIVLAIVLHHHTMKGRSIKLPSKVTLCEDCLAEVITAFSRRLRIRDKVYVPTTIANPTSIIDEILERHEENKSRLMKVTFLILIPVMVADNYSARNRNGKGTSLSSESVKVYNTIKYYYDVMMSRFGRQLK